MASLKKAFNLLRIRPLLRYQYAGIVSKYYLEPRPPPYDYESKMYHIFHQLFDKTTYRFNENTKVIVVDGPVAAGKTKFAKSIADALDMQYIPHANLDTKYITEYGIDLRKYNDELPDSIKSFDLHQFLENPNHPRTSSMQLDYYLIRLSDYINGLYHLLSTGQGVVFNRSFYSDFVFVETLFKFGFIPEVVRKHYYDMKYMVITYMMRPHVVIYLDVPVNVVLQRIKERNRPGEKNSPFYKPEILQYMETVYKQRYLKHIVSHSELLAYDWTEEGDYDVVIEDIEKLNVDDYHREDPKMADWRYIDEQAWCDKRILYGYKKHSLMTSYELADRFDVDTILYPKGHDWEVYFNVMKKVPGQKYALGFNADMGDGDFIYKLFPAVMHPYKKNF